LATVEPISKPSSSVPISFAEIQQLQSQPNVVVKERRSLRDIQAEEAELQAEVEFMKWWTAEEERIRLENEAMLASLEQQPKKPKQDRHRHLGKTKKSVGTSEGDSRVGQRVTSGERKRKTTEPVPDTTKGTSRG
jgi:inhibitor of Bruton tyrosine kinase